jgi:hypothetical protein
LVFIESVGLGKRKEVCRAKWTANRHAIAELIR